MIQAGRDGPATSATRPARNHFRPMQLRLPVLTLAIAAGALLTHFSAAWGGALEFNRSAIARGEGWRFVTAHLTHFDLNHLGWDLAVFVLLGSICEQSSRRRLAAGLILASVAIPAAIWCGQPQFTSYRGLSGLDCALFGIFTGTLLQRRDPIANLVGLLGLLGVVAKCSAELSTGVTLFAAGTTYAPVPLSHLVGTAAGLISTRWFAPADHPPAPRARAPLTFPRQKSCSPNPRPCP